MIKPKIGEKIKTERMLHGLTQEKLAKLLGVSRAAVSKWENGESYPDITVLPEIAKTFSITIDELFDSPPESESPQAVNQYQRSPRRRVLF